MEESIHKITSRLGEKVRLLDRFAMATARIKDGLEDEASRQFVRHVRERQAIIKRIETIDRELDRLKRENSLSVGKLSQKWCPKLIDWEFQYSLDVVHPAALLRLDISQQGLAIQRATVQIRDFFLRMI